MLEDTPRQTPRVPVHLPAHCERRGREWRALVLSLSENGCLVRSPEPLLLGSSLDLRFTLPREGELVLRAECAYQVLPDFGFIFPATAPTDREAIRRFVTDSLKSC